MTTGFKFPAPATPWWPVLAMALITFASRLMLFTGIKHLGGIQTALLGLAELIVTVGLAQLWLGEHLSPMQWIGTILLMTSIVLVGLEKVVPQKRPSTGLLAWLNPPTPPTTDIPWNSRP
jgi:drug/metabolite transporter (DMT)-like permease